MTRLSTQRLLRVVARWLGVLASVATLASCGDSEEPDGPYVPVHCDDTFGVARAGIRASSDGTLEVSQADEDVSEICGYGYTLGGSPCPAPDWFIKIGPAFQSPGVLTGGDPDEGPSLYCVTCEGGLDDGGSAAGWDDGAVFEITAIDEEHVAGCILGDPDRSCARDDIRFDVPCPADSR